MKKNNESSAKREPAPRVVVVGVGNLLLKDEGIGVHAVKALQELDLPAGVKLIDAGTAPDLIAYCEAGDKLIIIDATRGGCEPGAIYRFRPQDLGAATEKIISAHELGVEQSLKLMTIMGNEPGDVIIIGVEPKEIDWGTEPTDELRQKIPEIVKIVLKEIGLAARKE